MKNVLSRLACTTLVIGTLTAPSSTQGNSLFNKLSDFKIHYKQNIDFSVPLPSYQQQINGVVFGGTAMVLGFILWKAGKAYSGQSQILKALGYMTRTSGATLGISGVLCNIISTYFLLNSTDKKGELEVTWWPTKKTTKVSKED